MAQPQMCFGCGKIAPETETSYTLISSAHGWRVSREKGPSGESIARWRCNDCWKKFRENKASDSTPSAPNPRKR